MGNNVYGLEKAGVDGQFFASYEAALPGSLIESLCFKTTSNHDKETLDWIEAAPSMEKFTGHLNIKELLGSTYSIKNVEYKAAIEILKRSLRRGGVGAQWQVRVSDMARKAAELVQSLMTTSIEAGHTTGGECYDGQYFFDSDHSTGSSGSLRNILTSSQYPVLNVATAASPTPYEMAQAIMTGIGHFYTFKDSNGDPINGGAKNFLVMVPVAGTFWTSAQQAKVLGLLANTTSVVQNPVNSLTDFNFTVMANPRMTWTTDFAIFRTDGVLKPFILQEEQPLETDMLLEGSDTSFKEGKYLYKCEWSGGLGYGLWQHAIRLTLN